jgi:choline dehydrogenase-like flavoprotein
MVSMGNAVRSGLHPTLKEYYSAAESEMGVTPVPDDHMGKGTKLLRIAHKGWHVMPKAIDFSLCKGCGLCPTGCPTNARWSSRCYLSDAKKTGCEILTDSPVKRVLIESGRAVGVELGNGKTIRAGGVVLSAGAVETPRILQRSGVDGSGEGLFADTFITVGGLKRGIGMNAELGMALYAKREGYLLSPHYSSYLLQQLKQKKVDAKPSDILGIMVKIEDEPSGRVTQDNVT